MRLLIVTGDFHPNSGGANRVVWFVYRYFIENYLGNEFQKINFIYTGKIDDRYKIYALKKIQTSSKFWAFKFIEQNIKLTKYLEKVKADYDIIHVHNFNPLNGHTIATFHSSASIVNKVSIELEKNPINKLRRYAFSMYPIIKYIEKTSFKNAKYIHLLSKENKEDMENFYNIKKQNYFVIPNPVDYKKFSSIKKMKNLSKNKIINIGFIANRYKTKGIKILIRVAEYFKKENIIFNIYGADTKELQNYLKIIGRKKLPVLYRGFKKIEDIIKEIDLLLLPTYWETFNMSMLECLASGVPVIINDVSGAKEAIINGVNGYICKNSKIETYIRSIEFFLDNPEKITEFGENAKKIIKKNFDIPIIAEKYLKIYKSILDDIL